MGVIGLLNLDYKYTGVPGGIADETALGYATRSVVVNGLTFERAKAGELTPGLEAAFKEAVDCLIKGGDLIGISSNCGFMMFYQLLVRKLSSVPVFMSPLMQAPLVAGSSSGQGGRSDLLAGGSAEDGAQRPGAVGGLLWEHGHLPFLSSSLNLFVRPAIYFTRFALA